MRTSRLAVVLTTSIAAALLALPGTAAAGDTVKVFVMDRCEPESFDDAVEPGTCVRNGGVTFGNFLERVNPKDGGHNAWRFSRGDVDLRAGQEMTAINTGGEFHTFTEVANFGRGLVPELNAALPPGTPNAAIAGPFNGIGAGETIELGALSTGTHLFECLIHPWMRTVAEQH